MARSSSFRGYSLVELLVALALGVIISAAALQMFVSSQQSAGFQRGMTDIQSSGRFALDFLRDDLWKAGDSTVSDPTAAILTAASESPGNLISSNAATAGINLNDQLVMRFFASTPGVDCEGNNYAANVYIISRYFVRTDADTGLSALACDASSDDKTTATNTNTAGQVIIAGVDSFQVLYGVDDGLPAAGIAQVNRYVTSTQYLAIAAPRPAILSVRIGLLLSSTELVAAAALAPTQDYWVLDNQIVANTVPADGRARRLFVGTIALKNFDRNGV